MQITSTRNNQSLPDQSSSQEEVSKEGLRERAGRLRVLGIMLLFLLNSFLPSRAFLFADDGLLTPPRTRTVSDAPPLPRKPVDQTPLEGLRGMVSRSKQIPSKQVPSRQNLSKQTPSRQAASNHTDWGVQQIGTTASPVQTVRTENQIPNRFPANDSVQASFAAQPADSHTPSLPNGYDTENSWESSQNDYLGEDEEASEANLNNAVLNKTIQSRSPADGSETEEGTEEKNTKNTSDGWTNKLSKPALPPVLSIAGSLLIVIAAFFLLVILFRKVAPQSSRPLPKEAFECLGKYYLTQKHQLQVLRLGNRIVLVSVMPDRVRTLAEITDPDETVSFLGLCRRLDHDSATEMFRKSIAGISEEELTRMHDRPAVRPQKQHAGSLDLYSDPDESLASLLARGRNYGR